MVFSDRQLREWFGKSDLINPASIDLRLGDTLREPHSIWNDVASQWGEDLLGLPRWSADVTPIPKRGHILWPGDFVLCHSEEVITMPDDAIGLIISKSTTGRNGIEHMHSGLLDPGFSGQVTFEFHNVAPWPNPIKAGECYVQLVMVQLSSMPDRTYRETGHYQDQRGPEPPRGHKHV